MEIKDMLDGLPDEARVLFALDYGDHSHTEQALTVQECDLMDPACSTVTNSDYSQSGLAVQDVEDEETAGDSFELPPIVLLR